MRVPRFERAEVRTRASAFILSMAASFTASAYGGAPSPAPADLRGLNEQTITRLAVERGMLGGASFAGVADDAGRLVGWGHANARAGHAASWSRLASMGRGEWLQTRRASAEWHPELAPGIYPRSGRVGDARHGFAVQALGSTEIIASPAPEPGTWVLMLLGLGVIGSLNALRKRSTAGMRPTARVDVDDRPATRK